MACNVEASNVQLASRSGLGEISMCGCGVIHVSIGAVSLRLVPEAFCELVVMCRSAADALLAYAHTPEFRQSEVVH